jgi:hypothetical protein
MIAKRGHRAAGRDRLQRDQAQTVAGGALRTRHPLARDDNDRETMAITDENQELYELRDAYRRLRPTAERVVETGAYPTADDEEARIDASQLRGLERELRGEPQPSDIWMSISASKRATRDQRESPRRASAKDILMSVS